MQCKMLGVPSTFGRHCKFLKQDSINQPILFDVVSHCEEKEYVLCKVLLIFGVLY